MKSPETSGKPKGGSKKATKTSTPHSSSPSPVRAEQTSATILDELARELEAALPSPRGACAGSLLRLLHARTPAATLARHRAEVKERAVTLLDFIDGPLEQFRVRIREVAPQRFALESSGPDQPFILDSLLEVLRVQDMKTVEVLHPIVSVEREPDGTIRSIGPPGSGKELVSVIHIELAEALAPAAREKLEAEATEVLAEARVVVQDYHPMLRRLRVVEEELGEHMQEAETPESREEFQEALAFAAWLRRANFVFLGYRGYDIKTPRGKGPSAEPVIEIEHGSGLGILRDEESSTFYQPTPFATLPKEQTERITGAHVVLVHKANSDSHVLRRARMDYIGFKKLDAQGKVAGEHRFLGLFTARAYNDLPSDIPILRKKLERVFAKANVVPGSHDHKEIFSIFTSIPKYELFMTDEDRIAEMIFSILSSAGRRDVKISYRPDFLEQGVSAMVLLPKDKFNAGVRVAIQKLLAEELPGTPVEYRLALSEEPLARLHFYFSRPPGQSALPSVDALETKVAELIRTWPERLADALVREHGEEAGEALGHRYAGAFPAAYIAVKSPETAVADVREAERALQEDTITVSIASVRLQGKKVSVLKIFRPREASTLSQLMPVLTHLGLHVIEEQAYRIAPAPAEPGKPGDEEVYLHSFRVTYPDGQPLPQGLISRRIEETIPCILAGACDDDALNSLVTKAGLDRYQVAMLRAYDAYLRQLGGSWTQRTTFRALLDNPTAAALLVELFEARFDPKPSDAQRRTMSENGRRRLAEALDKVQGIVEDQALRAFLNLIEATVRTNYFQRGEDDSRRPAFALKIRSADVTSMPDPRPLYEIFVQSVSMEGVHLRSGKVARGGIRWSSRPDDYRMEILGLMKAQRTKNAVIVPVGAKGGFILRRPSSPSPPSEEIRREYQVYIGALLDVTDDIRNGKVVRPRAVRVLDEADSYLVVAADRGTAAFSDTANSIAEDRGFWLKDAFASGGSRGYNHKKLGITARGAWECVRRHFREMGKDVDREPFATAGIGDMSGDVFGNGMIASKNIRLQAAFNHLHIFLDPDPDLGAAFDERQRLFQLPSSTWADYDTSRISAGGGVWRRDSKSIELSPRAREVLGVRAESLNGDELVRAILTMPCDLLFNGGIGTYVKASTESHADVGDPANNTVRVNGKELRARVVAEGGNLGVTQLGRIEYARAGGRINTDFIDNSAGVDLSDHEVNFKILLARALDRGALAPDDRDTVLQAETKTVCEQVLRDNYLQGLILSLEEAKGAGGLEAHRVLIEELSTAGLLNREVEKIPADQDLLRLRDSKMGLTRPQLSVLLAYAKIDAYVKTLATTLPDEADLEPYLVNYFPAATAERFAPDVSNHPLRREIAATAAVNDAINTLGVAFFHDMTRQTGAPFDAALRAFLVARSLCGAESFHAAVDKAYADAAGSTKALYACLERFQDALQRVALGALRRRIAGSAGATAASYAGKLDALRGADWPPATSVPAPASEAPAEVLERLSAAEAVEAGMDLADLRDAANVPVEAARAAWLKAGEMLLVQRVLEEGARVLTPAAEDVQTRASLLEYVRDLRRRLAAAILRGPTEESLTVEGLGLPIERERAARKLEEARVREPLTVSGLFVVVEALARVVDRAVPPTGAPRTAADASHRKESAS